ncbi:MAG: hypothetical protein ABEJ92_11915 [Halobacteriales archaeon]
MPERPGFTPFHAAGALFLLAGLVLAVYHGLAQFDLVPRLGWVSWSHIHYVTIGGFTQLLVGMLPQLMAAKLDRPVPPRWYTWLNFLGLNAGFLLLWFGRGWGEIWAFDAGLYAIWLLVAGLLVVLLRMAFTSERRPDVTVGLYLLSPFVFLWGIAYGYGLFGHVWSVPGGWLGLREAHVHANAWGFLAFAAIGTLYDYFPRIADTALHSDRLKRYSFPLFALGIFPLIVGPWIGMGRTVTATGLVLYGAGFVLYVYNLVKTYLASSGPPLSLSLLVAQFWILGPAGFAPFVLFGVEWVKPAYIEQGALHFFFMGWALPVALAGLLLTFRNLPVGTGPAERSLEALPGVVYRPLVLAWNVAVLAVGIGFFYQTQAWSAYVFGVGYAVLAALWGYYLVQAVRLRWAARSTATGAAPGG